MKEKLFKLAGHLLVILISVQAVFCVFLLVRTATNKDMALFGYRFYYIVSPSMEPTIQVGAQIVVKETDVSTLEVDDIITFASRDPAIAGYPNTHRIVEITTDEQGNVGFVTKGDNNPTADTYLVYPNEIYGKVVMIAPALKGLIMFYSFAATPIGFMVVVIMPLMLVFGAFMRSFIKELKKGAAEHMDGAQRPDGAETTDRDAVPGGAQVTGSGAVGGSTVAGGITAAGGQEALVAALVKAYVEQNPSKELTAEEAQVLAAGLIGAAKQKGYEDADGR